MTMTTAAAAAAAAAGMLDAFNGHALRQSFGEKERKNREALSAEKCSRIFAFSLPLLLLFGFPEELEERPTAEVVIASLISPSLTTTCAWLDAAAAAAAAAALL